MSPSPHGKQAPADKTTWHLQRCDGFLDLGMRAQARAELAAVPESDRTTVAYLRLLLRLSIEEENWPEGMRLASELRAKDPTDPTFVIQLAYSTRRAKGIASAELVLRSAQRTFPKVALIYFNLSCYACQMDGRRDDALFYIAKAIALEPALYQTALEDEDLRPIWPDIEA